MGGGLFVVFLSSIIIIEKMIGALIKKSKNQKPKKIIQKINARKSDNETHGDGYTERTLALCIGQYTKPSRNC